MKKISCILSALFCLSLLFASSCGGGKTSESDHSGSVSSEEETYEQKKLSGIDPVFSESQGYYNESPSVFEAASGERYLYYTRNTVKNDDATDSIAVRKATYTANGWTYGDAKTLLVPSESGWDSKSVFGADVVRGSFSYRGTEYSYLMAYSGSDEKNRANAEIGLAVSKTPDGEWVKVGSSPVVTFDAGHYDPMGILSYRGAIEPSLVSFDKGGKVYLFYTYYEYLNGSYVLEMDAGDLDHPVLGGRKLVPVSGLQDMGASNTQLYSGDFVFDEEDDSLIAVRNVATTVTVQPKVSQALQIVRAKADVLDAIEQEWKPADKKTVWWSQVGANGKIDGDSTAVEDDADKMFGYERIFGGAIVSDEYGHLLTYGELDVYFTTQGVYGDASFALENDYKYSQMIHMLTVTL